MDIKREMVQNVGPDGIDVREYTRDGLGLPSVTTVLKTRDEDMSNLHDWEDRNDGEGDNPYHKHLLWYSQQLGTLGHWFALSSMADVPWSADEGESAYAIQNVDKLERDNNHTVYDERLGCQIPIESDRHEPVWAASPRDVLYSVLKNNYCVDSWGDFYDEYGAYYGHDHYSDGLLDKIERDIQFFVSAQQNLWSQLGVTEDSIISAEQYLHEEQTGYAGQVDLVYEDPNGYIVVADLKSSSGCYDKHQIQGAAYAKAIERSDDVAVDTVDRLEVHRTHPRTGQVVAHTHEDADGLRPIHSTNWWDESYDELWKKFRVLAENFEYET